MTKSGSSSDYRQSPDGCAALRSVRTTSRTRVNFCKPFSTVADSRERPCNQADLHHDSQGREAPGSLKRSKFSVDIFPRRDSSRYEDEILAERVCCNVLVPVALYQTIPKTRGAPVRGLNWSSYEDDKQIQEGWDYTLKAKTTQTPPAFGNTYSFLASPCSSD